MKVKLNLASRIQLINIFPQESDYITLVKVKQLKDQIEFKESEIEEFDVKVMDSVITWNKNGNEYYIEVEVRELAEKEIVETLKKRNEEKKLTTDQIELYDLFVEKSGQNKE